MIQLSAKSQRVLGALVEKSMTTPDGYPISANALRTACNQKTGRDPVVAYTDEDVIEGIRALREYDLVLTKHQPGSRTPKFAHLMHESLDLKDGQVAALGVLLLRGPQTIGEVKGRTGRWHDYPSLEAVEELLEGLTDHKFHGALVERLPREPGQKEERWLQLLGPTPPPTPSAAAAAAAEHDAELAALRTEIAELRDQNERLKAEANELRANLDELTAP